MFRTSIYMQVFEKSIAQFVARKHALHCIFNNTLRMLCKQLSRCSETLSTWVARVANVFLFGHFFAGETNLLSIDDDHIIAAIYVRGKVCLVLTTQHCCNA